MSKVKMLDGTTSMYWAGRSAYQSGLTLAANPWDGNNPAEARADWSWRKGLRVRNLTPPRPINPCSHRKTRRSDELVALAVRARETGHGL